MLPLPSQIPNKKHYRWFMNLLIFHKMWWESCCVPVPSIFGISVFCYLCKNGMRKQHSLISVSHLLCLSQRHIDIIMQVEICPCLFSQNLWKCCEDDTNVDRFLLHKVNTVLLLPLMLLHSYLVKTAVHKNISHFLSQASNNSYL